MEWKAIPHDDPRFLEIVTQGVADEAGSLQMARAIADQMRRQRLTRVLIDHRQLDGVTGTAAAIYERPKLFRLIGVILGVRIAEVIREQHREHFHFLETVCYNRGFRLELFNEREKALAWLLG